MRRRAQIALAACLTLATLLLLRHDLRELIDTVRTCLTFYPFLQRHPEILYRFPNSKTSTTEAHEDELSPAIFHRVLFEDDEEDSGLKYEEAISSCRSLHPNWTHHLWTRESAAAFLEGYHPEGFARYTEVVQARERAEVLRYAVLEHFGGVFLDLGIKCLQPLDEIRALPFVTAGAYPARVDNSFFSSRPHHPFLRRLLEDLETRTQTWRLPFVEKMLSSDFSYFSNSWMKYVHSLMKRGEREVPAKERVYVLADTQGSIKPQTLYGTVSTPIFEREHEVFEFQLDTTTVVVMIQKHYGYFLVMIGLGAVFTSVWLWEVSRRRAQQYDCIGAAADPGKLEKLEAESFSRSSKSDGIRCR